MADEVGRIVAKIGVDSSDLKAGMAEARRAHEQLGVEVRKLAADYKQNLIVQSDFSAKTQELVSAQKQLAEALRDAHARSGSAVSSIDDLGGAFHRGGQGATAMSRGVLELTRGAEDFATGGLLGALNNITPASYNVARAMGASKTAANVLSAATGGLGTAVYLVAENWDLLTSALVEVPLENETQEMKRLGDATKLTADQQERLNFLKGQESGRQQNLGGKSEDEKRLLSGVGTAIDEAGPARVQAGVLAARRAHGLGAAMTVAEAGDVRMAQFQDERMAEDTGGFDAGGRAMNARKRIQERIDADDVAAAGGFLGAARGALGPQGDGARRALAEMARGGRFGGSFSEDLEAALGGGEVLGSEGKRKAAEKASKAESKALAAAEKARLEPAYADGLRDKAIEDEKRREWDRPPESSPLVKEAQEAEKFRMDENRAAAVELERRARLGGRHRALGDRLGHLLDAPGAGRALADPELQALHRAGSGQDPQLRKLQEVKDAMDKVARELERGPILKVRRRR